MTFHRTGKTNFVREIHGIRTLVHFLRERSFCSLPSSPSLGTEVEYESSIFFSHFHHKSMTRKDIATMSARHLPTLPKVIFTSSSPLSFFFLFCFVKIHETHTQRKKNRQNEASYLSSL